MRITSESASRTVSEQTPSAHSSITPIGNRGGGRVVLARESSDMAARLCGHGPEFTDDNSYYVVTPERPQRIRREVQLLRDWLVGVAAMRAP
jgi:hypothetical protein